ncbi:translation initiation factor IF-3 [Patescibacteria group bacterium]|nr:translation initiation factor IF-3 [Patescibacteria group bacterium]
MRVIDNEGNNLGLLSLKEALDRARERELDLIEISPTARPPVAKIMDYGKFQYQEQKKQKEAVKKIHTTEIKSMRIGLGTSQHDLEMKADKISKFLKQKDKVRIDLVLKGRAKYIDKNFIEERLHRILKLISEEYKISDGPKKGPSGINITIEHGKNK